MDARPATQLDSRRIVVLAGGASAERAVSLQTGCAVSAALRMQGRTVVDVDPAQIDLASRPWTSSDVAFIALHGSFGEDGGVQTILDRLDVPYTGSSAEASRLAFSKTASKVRMTQSGVPTPAFALLHRGDVGRRLPRIAERIGYPLVVKPDQQGSSLGVRLVASTDELTAAAGCALEFGDFFLLESAVGGTEWTLAVIDGKPLPLLKIRPPNQLFDFDAKYVDDLTEHTFEFDEPAETIENLICTGLAACRAIGTAGLARVDLMLDESGRPWVLEVNTVPGMTDHSLAPKAATRAGLSLGVLCDRLLLSALAHSRRERAGAIEQHPAPTPPRRRAG